MTQRYYGYKFDVAVPGLVSGLGTPRVHYSVNSSNDQYQEVVIAAPASPTADATYRIQMMPSEGHPGFADYKTDANPTQAEAGEGIYKAIVASEIYDFYHVSYDLVNFEIKLKSRRSGVNSTFTQVAKAPESLPGATVSVTEEQAATTTSPIPYGRFVVRLPGTDDPDEVRLPTTNSGVIVKGVTQETWFNTKNGIGLGARGDEYKPNDVMNVLSHSLQTEGIWVEADGEFSVDATIYIDVNRSHLLGAVTTIATNNMALPGRCYVVEGGQRINSMGKYAALLYIDL